MHASRSAVLSLGLCLTFIPACNEDFDSGVPENKRLDELDSDEEAQLCEAFDEALSDRFDRDDAHVLGCALAGESAAGFAIDDPIEACQLAYDECLAQPADDDLETDGECDVRSCDATVGELEACTSDQLAMIDTMAARARDFRCEDVSTSGSSIVDAEAQSEACEYFERACPDEASSESSAAE